MQNGLSINMKNCIVMGASGLIGHAIYTRLEMRRPEHIMGTYHQHQRPDLVPFHIIKDDFKQLTDQREGVLFFCSAMTQLSQIFANKEKAYAVNVLSTQRVLGQAIKQGWKIVFLSTDKVYGDGQGHYKETDSCHPITLYGQYKYDVEQWLQKEIDEFLIVRLSKVYGDGSNDLVAHTVQRFLSGDELLAATDQMIQPTWVDDASAAILTLVNENVNGIWNVACPQVLSRYQMTKIVCAAINGRDDLVKPVKINEIGLDEWHPRRSDMNVGKMQCVVKSSFDSFEFVTKRLIKQWKIK